MTAIYHTGVQAFMAAPNETATIEFETPAQELVFFIRGQVGPLRVRLLDEQEEEITSASADSSGWVQVNFNSVQSNDRFVKTVEMINESGVGFAALDDMTYCARQLQPAPELDNVIHFAQFGNGGGLTSQILLENRSSTETLVRLEAFGDEGSPLMVDLNGQPVDGSTEFILAANALRFLETDGQGDEPLTGAVTVRSQEPLAGVILFGGAFGLAGVGATGDFSDGFTAPIDSQIPALRTGVAIQNLDAGNNAIHLELLDLDAQLVATAQVMLNGNGHLSAFVDEFDWDAPPDFSDFRGILRVIPDEDVAATAIQVRPGQFASLPVTEIQSQQ
ncbi:MAG TPA: hypothetical protein VLU25_11535 [Acidobacteriota bacterium]|nr:hypothetical protein [Acidobacteriota bacterium]